MVYLPLTGSRVHFLVSYVPLLEHAIRRWRGTHFILMLLYSTNFLTFQHSTNNANHLVHRLTYYTTLEAVRVYSRVCLARRSQAAELRKPQQLPLLETHITTAAKDVPIRQACKFAGSSRWYAIWSLHVVAVRICTAIVLWKTGSACRLCLRYDDVRGGYTGTARLS